MPEDEDEDISIDLSKITRFFKKKKGEVSKEAKEVKKEIGEKIEEDKKEIKELKEDEKKVEEVEKEAKGEEEKLEKLEKEEERIEKAEEEVKEDLTKAEKKIEVIKKDVEEEKEEEVSIDFGKIKGFFKGLKGKEKKVEETKEEEISIDWKKTGKFFTKHKVILLLLIPIFLSIFFRAYSVYLPITDEWAENTVYNHFRSQFRSGINQQYPNLPDENKNRLVEENFNQFLEQNGDMVKQQIEALSQNYKQILRDDKGHTYLLAIDPYFWFAHARNYLRHGHLGDKVVDGEPIFSLRNGREGKNVVNIPLNSYVGVFLYKFIHLFNKNADLMRIMFFIPLIFVTLAVIPAFFIGRKIGGNLGGLFAGVIVAINTSLLSRTPAGFSDTDCYQVFFPLLIIWLFLEAFDTEKTRNKFIFAGLAGFSCGLYSIAWSGWWYIFDFVIVALGVYFVYYLITHFDALKKSVSNFIKQKAIKDLLISSLVFLCSSAIFVSLFRSFRIFILFLRGPFAFTEIKAVAITKIWPNVMTTVAEFNVVSLKNLIPQMGGRILFIIALIGIILSVIKKDRHGKFDVKYASLIVIWFIGSAYAFTKGTRFSILMVPAFAIAFGAGVGLIYNRLNEWISKGMNIDKRISSGIIIILLLLIMIAPIKAAHNVAVHELPSMNDGWYNSLTKIKDNATDAVITSWWDFGHWFYSISERRVTFDGADQGERIHWVGKSLLVDNETLAIGILRMLNCGQEKAPHVLECYLGGGSLKDNGGCDLTVEGITSVRAIDILNEIIVQNKKEAVLTLKKEGLNEVQIIEVLKNTHCDNLIEQFYITSEDMVRKSGVWGHFGSWDFKRAAMYQAVKKKNNNEGVEILKESFNLSDTEADKIYYEIQNTKADSWVTSWPSYASGLTSCKVDSGIVKCDSGLEVNLPSYDAWVPSQQGRTHPKSIIYVDKTEVIEKKFNDSEFPYSVILIPNGKDSYLSVISAPELAGSMFTRLFYLKGHGLKHFKFFNYDRSMTEGDIYTWKVTWEEDEPILVKAFLPPEEKRGRIISVWVTPNMTNEDKNNSREEIEMVLKLAKQGRDFSELAKEHSDDPSANINGGDLGWFERGHLSKLSQGLEDSAFNASIGDISEIFESSFGYHIFKLTGVKGGELFDKVIGGEVEKGPKVIEEEVRVEEESDVKEFEINVSLGSE